MPSLRQIRLATGLVLYLYVTLHFVNHALGNISVDAMESGLAIQKLIWQSLAGATILYVSLLTHMSLGFWALYERRRFRWTRLEAAQLVLGLSIPFLLTNHVIGTRVALSQFGLEKGYAQLLANFWVFAPLLGALQAILLLIVWIHGYFVVWHESGWGPHGRPEDLADVTDDALVAEATRLQRERQLDQGDVWRVLCGVDPERAYRGLQSEARARRWEPTAWRDLLWAAADKGDPALQFELTESLLEMPETTLAEVLEPAASWLQKRRETLKGEPPDDARFLRVWDRLAVLVYPPEAVPPMQAERDLVTTALNDPAGSLAWTFLDHVADKHLPPNSGFPSECSSRLARAASAAGRNGLLARALLMRSLAYIESIDHKWAETYLMPGLTSDQPFAGAMWVSFAGGGHIGTARLFNAVKARMLEAFAQPTMADHDLEGLMIQLLTIAIAHRRSELADYLLSSAEIKRALSAAPPGLRAIAAWRFWREMEGGAPTEKAARWRQTIGPIFQEIWPLDARFRDDQVSERLVLMCLECGEAFDEAVDAVIDFLVPFPLYLLAHTLRLEKYHEELVTRYPKPAIRLANALIDPARYPIPNDLAQFLELCVDIDPSAESEPSYKRLYGLRRQQGA